MIKEIPILISDHNEWKDVPGYEGLYIISIDGVVKSLARNGIGSLDREMGTQTNSCGYLTILLSKNNVRARHLLHRIIALCFVSNPLRKPFVNHKDGNKLNNSVNNLEWVTASENVRHAIETGLKKDFRRGVSLTATHKVNLSQSLKGRVSPCGFKGKTHSEESKLKSRLNNLGKSRNAGKIAYQYPVVQTSKEGVAVREWNSATEAARALGINQGNINSCLKGRKSSAGGYKWKYK